MFTEQELQLIQKALPLLFDKGPGWPVVSQDAFFRFRTDLLCLQDKVAKLSVPVKQ